MRTLKRLARRALGVLGLAVRPALGLDFLADARKLLGATAGLTLFDAGANVGQTLEDMRKLFRQPRVYSFEPSPTTFAELSRRFGGKAGVTLENLALGDAPGELPFHANAAWSVNDSLLAPTFAGERKAVTVSVETVDAYCNRSGIAQIDLLKIDTQGYDLRVLQGAAGMLAAGKIRLFSAEANLTPMYEGQPAPSELFALAERFGYRLAGVYPGDYWGDRLAYFNALFARD